MKNKKLNINNIEVLFYNNKESDYISLSDMAKYKDSTRSDYIIQNWMRTRNSIEFLGLWETIHNPNFNSIEFDGFKNKAGANSFTLTPKKWIQSTNATGIISKSGRYGGTYAHKDIAFEFTSWLSPQFKLYLIIEYQRLKEIESNKFNLEWNVKRILSKTNYQIHTDAIKKHIIPKNNYLKTKEWLIYAEEADLLNVALYGCTAKDWRKANPNHSKKKLNIRDFSSINELVVLSNLENINALMIGNNIEKYARFEQLVKTATSQIKLLNNKDFIKSIKKLNDSTYINQENKLDK